MYTTRASIYSQVAPILDKIKNLESVLSRQAKDIVPTANLRPLITQKSKPKLEAGPYCAPKKRKKSRETSTHTYMKGTYSRPGVFGDHGSLQRDQASKRQDSQPNLLSDQDNSIFKTECEELHSLAEIKHKISKELKIEQDPLPKKTKPEASKSIKVTGLRRKSGVGIAGFKKKSEGRQTVIEVAMTNPRTLHLKSKQDSAQDSKNETKQLTLNSTNTIQYSPLKATLATKPEEKGMTDFIRIQRLYTKLGALFKGFKTRRILSRHPAVTSVLSQYQAMLKAAWHLQNEIPLPTDQSDASALSSEQAQKA